MATKHAKRAKAPRREPEGVDGGSVDRVPEPAPEVAPARALSAQAAPAPRKKPRPEDSKLPWVLIAFGAILLGLWAAPRVLGFARGAGQHAMVGQVAPELSLVVAKNAVAGAAEGSTLRLAQLRGQPLLLDFWASWCGPCGMQAPILERLSQRYAKAGLVVIGVNVDDTPEVARRYAEKKELSYPIVVDTADDAQHLYGVRSLPSVVLVDKDGKVRGYWAGLVDEGSLDEALGQVM